MTHNGFTRIGWNQITTQNGFLKFDSNRLPNRKNRILFQINSGHKNLSKSWFESTHDSTMLFIPSFAWPILGIQLNCRLVWPLFGFSTLVLNSYDLFGLSTQVPSRQIDSNELMTQATSLRIRIDSTHDSTQVAFQELTQNQLMTQTDSQVLIQIDPWLKMLPEFLFKSTRDSSEKHLILSELMIRLWVIPVWLLRWALSRKRSYKSTISVKERLRNF